MKVAGVLLAGGASRRFGSEKALARRGAGLLVDAPLRALLETCDIVAMSAQPASGAAALADARGFPVLPDPDGAPKGPLAGLLSGLRWAAGLNATALATAPCDAPLLQARQMTALIREARTGAAAVARSERGLEPLIAVWPVAAGLAALEPVLASGRHPPVAAVLTDLRAVCVDGFDAANINTPGDLARVERGDPSAMRQSRSPA